MNVEKKFLIVLLIIFLVSITGVSAIEAPGNDTGGDDISISGGVDDVRLDVLASDEGDVSSVADEDQSVNDDVNLTDVADEGSANLSGTSQKEVLGAPSNEDKLGATIYGPSGAYFNALADTIEGHAGDTIILDHTYNNNNGGANRPYGIAVHDGTVVMGQSSGRVTLDRNSASARLFAVDNGATVTFKNLNMINGHRHDSAGNKYGGVVHVGTNADVTFENCAFDNDYWEQSQGGGVIHACQGSRITLINCVFTNCRASNYNGGAIYCESGCTAIMKGTTFANVRANGAASTAGGVLYFSSNCVVDLDNCNFTKCFVAYNNDNEKGGGAIYFGSGNDIALTNCNFIDDYVSNTNDAGGKGGSIYIAATPVNTNIKGCLFSGSTAPTMGGAVYLSNANMANNHNITFDACTFVNNVVSANSAVIREGGAISANSVNNLYVINSNFENNRVENNYNNANAAASGGAISVRDGCKNLNIIGTTFASNKALNSYVSSNVKNGAGAAIHFIGNIEDSMIKGCTFTSNTASRDGGAIMFGTMNNAQNTIRNTHVLDSTFTSNQASYGGAIFLNTNVENQNVTGCTFTSNKATANEGGAINYYGSSNKDITIGSAFISNVATTHGSAIAFDLSTATFTNIKFIGASFKGHSTQSGTVYFSKGLSSLHVENTTFESNTVTEEGSSGAFYFPFVSNANFINSKFINNMAPYGGALYIVPGSNSVFHFEDCEFTGNTATVAEASGVTTKGGGAIYFYKYQTGFNIDNLTFLRTSFTANSAKTFGGAVFLLADDDAIDFYRNTKFDSCNFTGNKALGGDGKGGGAIMCACVENLKITK